MRVDIEQLKTLVENGDKTALESYILSGIEKSDVETVSKTNDEVKRYFDSEKDKHFSTALETWKTNNLNPLIETEVRKRNPEQTEEQKRIASLEQALEDQKKEAQREKLTNLAMKEAGGKGLPTDLIGFFLADDEEGTKANLGKFEETFNQAVQAAVETKFKEHGRNPKTGTGANDSVGATFAESANNQSKPVETTLWD